MARSTFAIATFFKLVCILSLIFAPKVVAVYVEPCAKFMEIGDCPDDDNDPLFTLCQQKCKDERGKHFGICYDRAALQALFGLGNVVPDDGGGVTNGFADAQKLASLHNFKDQSNDDDDDNTNLAYGADDTNLALVPFIRAGSKSCFCCIELES